MSFLKELSQCGAQESTVLLLQFWCLMPLMEAIVHLLQELPQALEMTSLIYVLVLGGHAPIREWGNDVLTHLEVSLQVCLEEGQTAEVFRAPCRPVLVVFPGTTLDGEGAPILVYLEEDELPVPAIYTPAHSG